MKKNKKGKVILSYIFNIQNLNHKIKRHTYELNLNFIMKKY